MHEVIHLSFGPQANELNSLFFNTQESYFVYTREEAAKSHIDPSIRFQFGTECTPRSLFWDYRNVFGKLSQYNENYDEPLTDDGMPQSHLPITKISKPTISAWTSRLRVPLHPQSLWTIPGWEVDPDTAPFGRQRGAPENQEREFDLIEEGREQFEECFRLHSDDYLDLNLRPLIEKCDLLSGINLVTDFGGWSGMSASYLETMRDEYVPKHPVFTWSISRNQERERAAVQRSRLEALLSFAEFSTLVIPLQDQQSRSDFTENAKSHIFSFETVCLLSSLRKKRVSMHDLHLDLTTDTPRANIIHIDNNKIKEFGGKDSKVRNSVHIWRGDQPDVSIDVDSRPRRSENVREYLCPQKSAVNISNSILELNNMPLNLRKLGVIKDHELKEQIYDMTEPYIWSWIDDFSDDDYA